ncbi:MAG: nucleotidyltransferase domain-containing protein [Acidobacteriota bacterium]
MHDPIARLAAELGESWPHLKAGQERAQAKRRELDSALTDCTSSEASIVVFGSLARDEFSAGSDIDWTLLVDGPADPRHLERAQSVDRHVRRIEQRKPGREGTFGSMAFSHDLVHQIGGEDDTNSNTTRRILLLLESAAIGRPQAWERVVHHVLRRYLAEDRGLWFGSRRTRMPRFLLNDIVRYWRTMTVDFAYKQRSRAGEGWALRNIKLRTSRKLIFVAGLLTAFCCETGLAPDEKEEIFGQHDVDRLTEHFRRTVGQTPLEMLATAFQPHGDLADAARQVFGAYDRFLGLLADDDARRRLSDLTFDDLGEDELFHHASRTCYELQEGLDQLFLTPGAPLFDLTVKFGVF